MPFWPCFSHERALAGSGIARNYSKGNFADGQLARSDEPAPVRQRRLALNGNAVGYLQVPFRPDATGYPELDEHPGAVSSDRGCDPRINLGARSRIGARGSGRYADGFEHGRDHQSE